jgi:hypothetical protein
MSGEFKVLKQKKKETPHSNLVQEKIDLAAKKGMSYELSGEDKRIDKLHNNEDLVLSKRVKTVDRIMVNGQEKLVASVEYVFKDGEGNYVDKYVQRVGESLDPVVVRNPDTNEVSTTRNVIKRDVDFNEENLNKILSEIDEGEGGNVEYRFYNGTESEARPINGNIYEVKNPEFFKQASFEELQIGRENRMTSTILNKITELREKTNNKAVPNKVNEESGRSPPKASK